MLEHVPQRDDVEVPIGKPSVTQWARKDLDAKALPGIVCFDVRQFHAVNLPPPLFAPIEKKPPRAADVENSSPPGVLLNPVELIREAHPVDGRFTAGIVGRMDGTTAAIVVARQQIIRPGERPDKEQPAVAATDIVIAALRQDRAISRFPAQPAATLCSDPLIRLPAVHPVAAMH
jgi:hypothetical protein